MTKVFKTYYQLTKPGIVYGNLVTATAGFLLACKFHIDFQLLLATLAGIALVIAAACVTNNYLDRKIDRLMSRTKNRALATGSIPPVNAFVFAGVLAVVGFLLLAIFSNKLTLLLGLLAIFVYVVLYGIAKRKSVHGTAVGAIAGSLPLVAGYTAVTNRLDTAALLLFVILGAWQMPHFYAIAIRRIDEYKKAGLPVWPVKKGIPSAKRQIMYYIAAFTVACTLLTFFGYTGYVYLIVMLATGIYWFYLGLKGLGTNDDTSWAKRMFLFSLVVNLVLSVMLSVGAILP